MWKCGQERDATPCSLSMVGGRAVRWSVGAEAGPAPHQLQHSGVEDLHNTWAPWQCGPCWQRCSWAYLTVPRVRNLALHPSSATCGVREGKMPSPFPIGSCSSWESWSWPSPVLAFGRVNPEPCPGNTIELNLWKGVQLSCSREHSRRDLDLPFIFPVVAFNGEQPPQPLRACGRGENSPWGHKSRSAGPYSRQLLHSAEWSQHLAWTAQ